jgi:hypothetical protein
VFFVGGPLLSVYDNFYAAEEGEVDDFKDYETEEEAVADAKKILDHSLRWELDTHEGLDPDRLFDQWISCGDWPYVSRSSWDAREYAKERCASVCAESAEERQAAMERHREWHREIRREIGAKLQAAALKRAKEERRKKKREGWRIYFQSWFDKWIEDLGVLGLPFYYMRKRRKLKKLARKDGGYQGPSSQGLSST